MSNKMYMQDGKLVVPDHVVIPFIEGDGVGSRNHSGLSENCQYSSRAGLRRQAPH